MNKRVADIIFDTLAENDIEVCFCVVGGGAMHLDNALRNSEKITPYFNHHEQACSMAAEGYARLSGKMASVCVTSGPGGTNAINGVQGAWVDNIPMIVISGFPRWDTAALSTDLNLRASGVQENDIISMVSGITKYAKNLIDPRETKRVVKYAIDIAMEGRRGPVWINVPLDVQAKMVAEEELLPCVVVDRKVDERIADKIQLLNEMIQQAEKPCVLFGSGIRASGTRSEFIDFINRMNIPVVGGYLQSDVCYKNQKGYFGLSGSSGSRCGNFILQNSDFILVLGNSLATGQTGFFREGFAPKSKIVMIDAEKDEARKSGLHIDLVIEVDLCAFFEYSGGLEPWETRKEWIEYCEKCNKLFSVNENLEKELESFDKSKPVPYELFWSKVYDYVDSDAVFCLGNSTAIMGGIEDSVRYADQRVIVNYNCGSMGHDLPLSIGACIAGENKCTICVTGDGSIMMNLQELETIRYNNLRIKIVLFNNGGYNALKNTFDRFFNGEYVGCDYNSGISFPDFGVIANAFGFLYKRCKSVNELEESLEWLSNQNERCFLEIDELSDEIYPPSVSSVMDENGVFYTPALHVMSPLLDDDLMDELLID